MLKNSMFRMLSLFASIVRDFIKVLQKHPFHIVRPSRWPFVGSVKSIECLQGKEEMNYSYISWCSRAVGRRNEGTQKKLIFYSAELEALWNPQPSTWLLVAGALCGVTLVVTTTFLAVYWVSTTTIVGRVKTTATLARTKPILLRGGAGGGALASSTFVITKPPLRARVVRKSRTATASATVIATRAAKGAGVGAGVGCACTGVAYVLSWFIV